MGAPPDQPGRHRYPETRRVGHAVSVMPPQALSYQVDAHGKRNDSLAASC